jgi:hypothetical protein
MCVSCLHFCSQNSYLPSGFHFIAIRYTRGFAFISGPNKLLLTFLWPVGEGGTFALFQGLFPPEHEDFDSDRTLTGDSFNKTATGDKSSTGRKLKEAFTWPLFIWVNPPRA